MTKSSFVTKINKGKYIYCKIPKSLVLSYQMPFIELSDAFFDCCGVVCVCVRTHMQMCV